MLFFEKGLGTKASTYGPGIKFTVVGISVAYFPDCFFGTLVETPDCYLVLLLLVYYATYV